MTYTINVKGETEKNGKINDKNNNTTAIKRHIKENPKENRHKGG